MIIKTLSVDEVVYFRKVIERFIFESNKNAAYMDSYVVENAVQKTNELVMYLREEKALVFGAVENDLLLGFIWAYVYPFRDDKKRLYLGIVHVDEKYRNKKIGQQLLDSVSDYACANGFSSLYLHAEAFNTRAICFYEANGFLSERIQLVKEVKKI